VVERLEERQLLTAVAISAVEQYGAPSVFAIDSAGNVSYNFLTSIKGQPAWSGWTAVPGGVSALAISTDTILAGPVLRPDIFLLNSANDVFYNSQGSSGQWNGWSLVGANVGASAISSGVIPIADEPYVVAIDGAKNIEFNYLTPGGTWAGWSTVATNVGASAISTGIVHVSTSPAIYEPYVFALNSSGNVDYVQRNAEGSWSALAPVGAALSATAISSLTLANKPYVFALDGTGKISSNYLTASDPSSVAAVTSPSRAITGLVSTIHSVHKLVRHKAAAKVLPHHRSLRVVEAAGKHRLSRAPAVRAAVTPSGSLWAGWSPVGVGSGATPATAMSAIVAYATGTAFSLNTTGLVYSTFGTAGLWRSWSSLGSLASGVNATKLTVTSQAVGLPFAFVIGTDSNVYWIDQSAWATWTTWASLGTPS
jgi:hypothetical protein